MTDHVVRVILGLPKGGDRPSLGGAFSLRSTSAKIPPPPGVRSLFVPGFFGLFVRERGGQPEPWLLLSAPLAKATTPEAQHTALVTHVEGGSPHICRWYGGLSIDLLWNSSLALSYIRATIPRHLMKTIWRTEGDPHGKGSWLSSLILPRTTSGAIRHLDDFVQLWTPLL